MDERHERVKKLFNAVCDLSPAERAAVLDRECGGDTKLRAEVESLVRHHVRPPAPPPTSAMPPDAPATPGAPARIGPYRVIREIGRGGMGVVYLGARETDQFQRRVAIKVLKRGLDTEEILRRFELERQVLAALSHPGIARLYDAAETEDGLPYFAMEYVEGQPIDDYCDTHRLRIAERLQLFRQVCAAVQHAHQNLVVHRDLKPSNILVNREGAPKLMDFGIAKLINPEMALFGGDPTAPELRMMTPEYASPEQVRGNPITTASDIYSLGVLLYELLTGHRPYRLRSRIRNEVERVICSVDPEKPSTAISRVEEAAAGDHIPGVSTTLTPDEVSKVREGRPDRLRRRLAGDIDNIVLMAMRKEPQRRYVSAEQFAEDIRRHLAGLTVIAQRDTARYRAAKFVRRHRAGVATAATIGVALVGWGVTAARGWAAERRHSAAESKLLVEVSAERDRTQFMLDMVMALTRSFILDFNDRIAKLDGTLPARQSLVTTALLYLEQLRPVIGDNAAAQRQLALAYDRIGDIQGGFRGGRLGDTAAALQSYRTGLDLRQELLVSQPDDRELQHQVAESHRHLGDVLRPMRKLDEALGTYSKALEIHRRLRQADDTYRREAATDLLNVGAVLKDKGNLEGAMRHCQEALDLFRALAAQEPSDTALRDQTVACLRVGAVLSALGDEEGALRMYQEAIPLRQRMAAGHEENNTRQRDLGWAYYFAGDKLLNLGRTTEAVEHVAASLDIFTRQAEKNPEDSRAKADLAMGWALRARTLGSSGDHRGGLEGYQRADSALLVVIQQDPKRELYSVWLGEVRYEMAGGLALAGDANAAISAYRRALETVAPLAADGAEIDVEMQKARILSALGGLLIDAGDLTEAQSRLDGAAATYRPIVEAHPQNAAARAGLAETLQRLSRLSAARGYAAEAVTQAQQALQVAGRRDPSMMRDLAAALFMNGDRQGAIEAAEEALRLLGEAPEDAPRAQLRRRLETELGEYRRAGAGP